MAIKIAQQQQLPELNNLRTSIVNFHQNMRIAYDKLKLAATNGIIQKAVLEAYKPYLENIAAAPVFGTSFTMDQLRSHLRYLEGICKKFASINAAENPDFTAKYSKQPYYKSIWNLGVKVKESFTPLGTAIRSTLPDADLITAAPAMGNVMDKVGVSFVSQIKSYIDSLAQGKTPPATRANLAVQIMKMADEFLLLVNSDI